MPEADGTFSTKSAWNSIRSSHHPPDWVSSLWFPGHIPKFSFTTWQAIQDHLPTKDRLTFFPINSDKRCLLCNSETESVYHLFFSCSYSAWIWRTILRKISLRKNQRKSFGEEESWIRKKFKFKGQSGCLSRILFTSSIYYTWLERNCRLHDKIKTHKSIILDRICRVASRRVLFLKLNEVNSRIAQIWNLPLFHSQSESRFCQWVLPSQTKLKINTDASISSDIVSLGGILRDSKGQIISFFSVAYDSVPFQEAKLEAIIRAVQLARNSQVKNLWIESDSLNAVHIIRKQWPCPWRKFPALEKLHRDLISLNSRRISHIWRDGNKAADLLSKSNCICKGDPIPLSCIPYDLFVIALEDSSGTLYPRL
ncbi:uncharacterized protein LOC143850066 [Tasmannia lanceolata]|uniref:uncharacterized protein LOC143850066 n=1 Tax=Tasmannia lanceolata TaxID=3420 RepID=UPI0040647505